MSEIIKNWSNIKRFAMLDPMLRGKNYDVALCDELNVIVDFLQEVAALDGLDAVQPMASPIEFWDKNLSDVRVVGQDIDKNIGENTYIKSVDSRISEKNAANNDVALNKFVNIEKKVFLHNNIRKDEIIEGDMQEKGLFSNTKNNQFGYFIVPKVLPTE
jgi:Asp-tRNA(Asn)/Glu-tRNA(Gln) amidotransferase C subunit